MSSSLNSQFLTPERFRWVMAIGESTEAEWRGQKRIEFFQIGRVIRYTPQAALEFITRNSVRARGVGVGTSTINHQPSTNLEWERIERLLADQVRAVVSQRGSESVKEAA